ncbi:hypothetical protein AB0I60_12745 [Actinosynnema sp. NPDC050436]|uniref:hypothetical protein n=1 Tax=Actinosynnema sp. NPDC050436 TaxID=3155659 RepID=UPI0033EB70D6
MTSRARTPVVVAAALAGAAAATALLLPRRDGDPLAYPGSAPDVPFDQARRLAAVTPPACARGSVRYHVGGGAEVALDFAADDGCVNGFLAALGATGRPAVWQSGVCGGVPPVTPPAGSGARWEFPVGHRVETWRVEVDAGARRRRVTVVVNRSVFPQRVYARSWPAGQARAATSPVAAARARHSGE